MSIRALDWAFRADHESLNPTLKLLLVTLANFANDNDETYPRQSTIAKMTCLHRTTVCENLAKLEDLGFITATAQFRKCGGKQASLYKLNIAGEPPASFNDEPEPKEKVAPKPRKTAAWPEDYREQFWKLYPRRPGNSRKDAYAELERIEKSDTVEFSVIMTGLGHYAERMNAQVKNDPSQEQFIVHAVRWLKKARWETEGPSNSGSSTDAARARIKATRAFV